MPLVGAVLVMTGATVAALMTMVLLWVAFGNVPLAACTVKLNDPAAVGIPLRTPVVALSVRPVGSVPEDTLQVMGVVPLAVKL